MVERQQKRAKLQSAAFALGEELERQEITGRDLTALVEAVLTVIHPNALL